MTGLEAFIALRQRKSIRRKCWHENHLIKVKQINDNQYSMQILKEDYSLEDRIYKHANLFADLLKDLLEDYDDWEVVE